MAETIREGETVEGTVKHVSQNYVGNDESTPRFGYKIAPDDGDPIWVNGFGEAEDGLKGDRVRVMYDLEKYNGDYQHEVQNPEEDIEVVGASADDRHDASAPDADRPQVLNRQSAVTAVATMWEGEPPTDNEEYEKFRRQVEDVLTLIETGEWMLPRGEQGGDSGQSGAGRAADDRGQ